ncbi:MAG: S16 family serine protease [Actinomycetota bacterium]
MALFPDDPAPIDRGRRRRRVGWILLAIAVVGAVGFAMVPAPYVIERPGPVFNTLGTVENGGTTVPLIEIPGQTTFPTSGALDMLTVNLYGDRENSPSWFEVAQAWLDPSQAVLPIDEVYPQGETVQQSNKQDAIDMQNSQQDAIAAALTSLGYPVTGTLTVGGFTAGSPADAVLKNGDTIVSADGKAVDSVDGLRAIVAAVGAGHPLSMVVVRDGARQTVQLTPVMSTDSPSVPIVGIYPSVSYSFPFPVKIQLENVGGPSAGQMFALGIMDKLTAGRLNGGKKVAGTGTIDAAGDIGAIGGIRQKLYGARDAGATWFLAPYSNCDEVTGHIPSGIHVLAVKTLKDSLKALAAISSGSSTSRLLTCPAK